MEHCPPAALTSANLIPAPPPYQLPPVCIAWTLTVPVAASSGDLQPSSAGWPNPASVFITTLCQCPSVTLLDCAICSASILTEKHYKHVCLLTKSNGPLWLRSAHWKGAEERQAQNTLWSPAVRSSEISPNLLPPWRPRAGHEPRKVLQKG